MIEHVRKTLTTEETLEGAKTYLDICRTPLTLPCLAVGEKRTFCDLLRGLRFTIVGRFKRGLTQDFLKDRIFEMEGVVYEKENAENIMKSHSNILNIYVIVKDERDLINATGDKHQLEAMRTKLKLHRHCTASELSTDAESREDEKCSTKKKLSPAALACKRFASVGFMFITVEYGLEMMKSNVILDPEKYIIRPGLLINPMKINDMRPLLMDQIDDNKSIANTSAIVALKRYRNGLVKHNKTPADDRLLL